MAHCLRLHPHMHIWLHEKATTLYDSYLMCLSRPVYSERFTHSVGSYPYTNTHTVHTPSLSWNIACLDLLLIYSLLTDFTHTQSFVKSLLAVSEFAAHVKSIESLTVLKLCIILLVCAFSFLCQNWPNHKISLKLSFYILSLCFNIDIIIFLYVH